MKSSENKFNELTNDSLEYVSGGNEPRPPLPEIEQPYIPEEHIEHFMRCKNCGYLEEYYGLFFDVSFMCPQCGASGSWVPEE